MAKSQLIPDSSGIHIHNTIWSQSDSTQKIVFDNILFIDPSDTTQLVDHNIYHVGYALADNSFLFVDNYYMQSYYALEASPGIWTNKVMARDYLFHKYCYAFDTYYYALTQPQLLDSTKINVTALVKLKDIYSASKNNRLSFQVAEDLNNVFTFINIKPQNLSKAIDRLKTYRYRLYTTDDANNGETPDWSGFGGKKGDFGNILKKAENAVNTTSGIILSENIGENGQLYVLATPALQNNIDSLDISSDYYPISALIRDNMHGESMYSAQATQVEQPSTPSNEQTISFYLTLDGTTVAFVNVDISHAIDYLFLGQELATKVSPRKHKDG